MQKIPVTTLKEADRLLANGTIDKEDYAEFYDAFIGITSGYKGYLYANTPEAKTDFANECHDPSTGRFCEVPGHPKANPQLDRWAPDNPTQAKALQELKDRPSVGKQIVNEKTVKDAIHTSAKYDSSIRDEYTEHDIVTLPKHEETIETDSIIATHQYLERSAIAAVIHALDDPSGPWHRPAYLPIVIKKNGKNYLWDGHHRIEGARILNHKTTKVQIVESALIASATMLHLEGEHDQASHGSWAKTQIEADQSPSGMVEGQMPRKEVGVAVRRAISIIDQVHTIPDKVPKIPIRTDRRLKAQAAYEYYDAADGEKPKQISVNPERSQHLELSFAHEFGHYLESQVFGRRPDTPEMKTLRDAIYDTEAMATLKSVAEGTKNSRQVKGRASYYYSRPESFARAYAQYVAMKTQDSEMVAQVNGVLTHDKTHNNIYPHSQWGVRDFEPVYKAFDSLFTSKGLLKSGKGYYK